MSYTVLDTLSLASGAVNEDRTGAWGDRAWVIDGATDIGLTPLTRAASDASWFADEIHELLYDPQLELTGDLGDLPMSLAIMVARRFRHARTREPEDRFEHPSASGVVVRFEDRTIDYVSVGDCTLIVAQRGAVLRLGSDLADAGDKAVARAIAEFQKSVGQGTGGQEKGGQEKDAGPTAEDARRHVWPEIRARRNRLNTADGYGVWSITPPPQEFVRTGRAELDRGAAVLLASDGLMRLVDVYRALTLEDLVERARGEGLASLGRELRRIEAGDDANLAYPRAKTSDDATGLLLTID